MEKILLVSSRSTVDTKCLLSHNFAASSLPRVLVTGALVMALATAPAVAGGGNGGGSAGGLGGGVNADYQGSPGQDGWASAGGGGGGGPGAAGGHGKALDGIAGSGGAAGSVGGADGAAGGDASSTAFAGGGGGGGGADGYTGSVLSGGSFIGGNGGGGGNSLGNGARGEGGDGGGGGAGGYGAVVIGAGADILRSGVSLSGGHGGAGGAGSFAGGGGGDGGAGLAYRGLSLTVGGDFAGGAGGAGGAGRTNGGIGGDGGAGLAYQGLSLTVEGNLVGGAGGDSGKVTLFPDLSDSGAGGSGLIFDAQTVIVSGEILGGNGGSNNGEFGRNGTGGAGIKVVRDGVTIINAGTISGGLSGDGVTRANAITFAGGTNRLELWAGATINGTVDATASSSSTLAFGGNENGSFDLSQIGATAQYRGFQTFEKSSTSAWTFTGTSLDPLSWTVDAGKLIVNSSSAGSAVTVRSGATLGGSGTVGATVIQSGGILAPGNSIGTLHTGALTYQAGAIYAVELAQGGNTAGIHNDLTSASGLVSIDSGAILRVTPENGTDTGEFYVPGLTYTIITSTVGIDGSFGALTDDYLFLNFIDSYDGNNVYLTSQFSGVSLCLAGSTANQCAAAKAVQSSAPSALFSAIVNLSHEDVARAAFDQLSGEIHASAKGMLLQDSRFVRDAATDRIRAAFDGIGAAPAPVLAYGEGGAELVAADTDRFAVWGNAFGSWGDADSDGNAAAFDRSIGGLLLGGDVLVGDAWRAGLLTGFSRSSFDVDDRASSGDATSYYLGAYGGGQWGAVSLRTGAAYSWNSIETHRTVSFPGISEVLSADYDGATAQIFGEAGYRIDTAAASFEPFANLAYVNVRTDAFSETGGSAALSQASSNTDATFTTLGIRASGDFALGTINATARGMIGWRHAFGDVTPLSTIAFAGSNAFTVAGVPIARDAAVLEAGLDFDIAPMAKLGISYTGQFGSGVSDNGAKLDLSVKF